PMGALYCLVAAVFGCVAENVIQNTLTNYERIFYATLVKPNTKNLTSTVDKLSKAYSNLNDKEE
ncbi:hypothetical protein ABE205_21025, partial [Brevibacillus agri]|uniref:hypothetical protein n=1 Tax=Brevibacillus agri TaxID=51101 RepID=UPI003D1F4ABC